MVPDAAEMAGHMTLRRDRTESPNSIELKTPAKINLTLAVLGKRPDGFHDIESLVVPVGLYDDLEVSDSPDGQIHLTCDDPALPTNADNLAYQAAELLASRASARSGVRMRLTKRIPVGAGLGGGSSDAAAALVGLNRLWQLGLNRSALAGVAAELGSDVPLFVADGAVITRGRGERIERVRLDWVGCIVLIVPPFAMSTAEVYQQWQGGSRPPRTALEIIEACRSGQNLDGLLYNMLEEPAFALEPRLAELHAKTARLGAPGVRMTGSGSALFALFDRQDEGTSFAAQVTQQLGVDVHVVSTTECEHL
jgi:4-diphosphocytidyl-2-C-methyl-D-erythritol kinase